MVAKGGGGGEGSGMDGEFGVVNSNYYFEWINKVLLYNIGNCVQFLRVEQDTCIYMCVCVCLLGHYATHQKLNTTL